MKHRHTFAWCVMCASLHQFQIVLYKRELLLPFLNLLFVLARRSKLHMQVILYSAFIGLSEPNNFSNQRTVTIQKGNERNIDNSNNKWQRKRKKKKKNDNAELNCLQRESAMISRNTVTTEYRIHSGKGKSK